MDSLVHPFEKRGLGAAPFAAGTVTEGEGKCAFCGKNPLTYLHEVLSADGRAFIVGSECIKRAGDEELRDLFSAKLAEAREARHARALAAAEAARNALPGGFVAGDAVEHPEFGTGTATRGDSFRAPLVRVEFRDGLRYVDPAALSRYPVAKAA